MQIIKHGKYYKNFTCDLCQCEFVAAIHECTMNSFVQNDGTQKNVLVINCPECNAICKTNV